MFLFTGAPLPGDRNQVPECCLGLQRELFSSFWERRLPITHAQQAGDAHTGLIAPAGALGLPSASLMDISSFSS